MSGTGLVYHEKQVAGLCGVHALNNLLQGHYFTEVDLMSIAQELDQKEREAMLEATGGENSEEYIRFLGEESGNVAADGNFSLQVLTNALKIWNLDLLSAATREGRPILRDCPLSASGYLCNLQEHWLALRPVGNMWWNLNSLYSQPEQVSPTYLHLLLQTLQSSGYSVFIVQGSFPRCAGDDYVFPPQNKQTGQTGSGERGSHQGTSDAQFDADIAAAIAASLGDAGPANTSTTTTTTTTTTTATASGGYRLGRGTPPPAHPSTVTTSAEPDDDAELQAAIALSLQQE